ncbi:MAG: DUF1302 domain-containing protein [Desulfuromonadales bacterium]
MMELRGLKVLGRMGISMPVLLTLLWVTPTSAFQFNLGQVDGSFDSTLSYGVSMRVADRDEHLVGLANGGKAYSVNGDDGNLNYNEGKLISNLAKVTSDLDLRYDDYGVFLRGTAFYDFESEDSDRERTELSSRALRLVGKNAKLLDAYAWANFDLGEMPGQVRAGNQVLSWGESTFIQNGINVINPFDVSKLRVPGSELKEALVPVGMVSASISPTEEFTFEGFYQYDWEQVEIDPTGYYWSTTDFPGKGGDRVLLGFGDWSDLGTSWQGAVLPYEVTDPRFMMVPRGSTGTPSDDGQYGLAMRVYAPGLNNTEFGFYFINYNSRLPAISGVTGTQTGFASSVDAATGIQTFAQAAASNPSDLPGAVTAGITAGTQAGIASGLDPATAQTVATGAVNAATTGNAALANAYIVNEYAQTAQYKVEYPEDIKVLGISFNTALDSIGASVQGEFSYHKDAPLQVDDVELLIAALSPLGVLSPAFLDNQITNGTAAPLSTYIPGYIERDVSQVQMTLTKLLGPTFGAEQLTLVGEVGLTHVLNMPTRGDLRLESPGTYTSGNSRQALTAQEAAAEGIAGAGVHAGKSAEPSSAFADATSWGYRAVAKLDYNNAIGAATLSPRIAWAQDVSGNSPGPGGNFVEGRKAVTFGLGASYQSTWAADLSYTNFFGAGSYNLVNDRDFVAFNVSYSF